MEKPKSIKISILTPRGGVLRPAEHVSGYDYDWKTRTVSFTVDDKESLNHGAQVKYLLGEGWSLRIEEQD